MIGSAKTVIIETSIAYVCLTMMLLALVQFASGTPPYPAFHAVEQSSDKDKFNDEPGGDETEMISKVVDDIVRASYPELINVPIRIKTFKSRTDFFRARFSVARFLTFREFRYTILVNPLVFERNAPSEGIRAIIAHELAHIAYYRRHDRLKLLGLMGLVTKDFTARFERRADLRAIKDGYGPGLIEFREWLYQNIPANQTAAKKRDYFSPAEIDLIVQSLRAKPELIDNLLKNVPRNLDEIRSAVENPD